MRASTDSFSFCTCQVFCCQVFYAVMETTSHPWSVAKPETFQSLSVTTGLDCCLFNGAELRFSVWRRCPPGHSNHGEHPERLPSGRVVKAAGKKKKKQGVSQGAACVRYRTFFFFFFAVSLGWHVHTNKRASRFHGRIDRVSVLSDADDSWDTLRKQINCPFLHKRRGGGGGAPHVLISQRRTCCEVK